MKVKHMGIMKMGILVIVSGKNEGGNKVCALRLFAEALNKII
jgi:hypothetical protein